MWHYTAHSDEAKVIQVSNTGERCFQRDDKRAALAQSRYFPQVERSLVISDVVFDKKMLTKEKPDCQMNEKLCYSAVCSALLNQEKVSALGFSRLAGYTCIVLFVCNQDNFRHETLTAVTFYSGVQVPK